MDNIKSYQIASLTTSYSAIRSYICSSIPSRDSKKSTIPSHAHHQKDLIHFIYMHIISWLSKAILICTSRQKGILQNPREYLKTPKIIYKERGCKCIFKNQRIISPLQDDHGKYMVLSLEMVLDIRQNISCLLEKRVQVLMVLPFSVYSVHPSRHR